MMMHGLANFKVGREFLTLEDVTRRLSRNVRKELPPYAA